MFEVGDKVTSEKFGEGVIIEINDKLDYPVLVKFIKSIDIEGFTKQGLYRKSNSLTNRENIKNVDNTPEEDYKKIRVTGFGFLLEFDNGICIYHPNQGQPFQVYPKHNAEKDYHEQIQGQNPLRHLQRRRNTLDSRRVRHRNYCI